MPTIVPTCDVTNVYITPKFCAIVNQCNATKVTEEDDCKNFCAIFPICAQQWDDPTSKVLQLKPQLMGCCAYCSCFKRTKADDVKMWPTKPGLRKRRFGWGWGFRLGWGLDDGLFLLPQDLTIPN